MRRISELVIGIQEGQVALFYLHVVFVRPTIIGGKTISAHRSSSK